MQQTINLKEQAWDGSEREKRREKYNCIIISKMLMFIYVYGHVYDAEAYNIRKTEGRKRRIHNLADDWRGVTESLRIGYQ